MPSATTMKPYRQFPQGSFSVILAILVILAVAIAPTRAAAELTLVEDGTARACIVLAAEPTRVAQFAALELQQHIKQITGAELPVVKEGAAAPGVQLHIGPTLLARQAGLTPESFKPQESSITFSANAIYLVGRDAADQGLVQYDSVTARYDWLPGFWEERGTLNAVYDLLEQECGVRWLNQTEYGTSITPTKTLKVAARNRRRVPDFLYRDGLAAIGDMSVRYDGYISMWTDPWPDSSPEFQKWDAVAHHDLHERAANPAQYLAARSQRAQLFLLRLRNGGQIQRCNHSLYAYYDRFWDKPETRHPEFFAQGYEGKPPQLCYTNRALIKQVAADACDYYDTGNSHGIFWNPKAPNWFPVEPMDNTSFCKCAACQALLDKGVDSGQEFSTGTHSNYFFNFVNEVAKELHKTHPERSVVTLAYASHAAPPTKIKLDPSVALEFCFSANRSSPESSAYVHEMKLLRQWAAEGSGRPLYLWLYDTFPLENARAAKLNCWPGAFAHTLGAQMRAFKKLGVLGMFHCGYGQDVEAFLTFKLMNDATLDVDTLLADYFTGIYGAAAEPMKRFYLEVEKSYMGQAPQYTLARLAELAALVAQADKLATTEREKSNLDLFKLNLWAYLQEGMKQRQEIQKSAIPALVVPRVVNAGGDVVKVTWDKAVTLPGPWYIHNTEQPARRQLSGRIAHDDTHLYLELVDRCVPAKLKSSAMVFPFDDWEIFVAAQRGLPLRQYAVNPNGLMVGLSHGEVNFRTDVPMEPIPLQATSDTHQSDRWVTRLTWPLDKIVLGGVKPGGKFYLNIARTWNKPDEMYGCGVEIWAPFSKIKDMSRAPELTLE